MRQSNLLANGQPQSCTVITPMCPAPESLEQQGQLRGIDAWPAIPHDHCIVLHLHADSRVRGRMLNGVLQQILQQREQRPAIGVPTNRAGGSGYRQAHAGRVGHSLQVGDSLPDHLLHRHQGEAVVVRFAGFSENEQLLYLA